jgi:hypothetical protein
VGTPVFSLLDTMTGMCRALARRTPNGEHL